VAPTVNPFDNPLDVADLRERVQILLDRVLEHQREVVGEVSGECLPLVDAVAELIAGGKRLRPGFCYWGWRGAGRPDGDLPLGLAASLELFQAAALLHDDVMDRSDTRRGRAAMHKAFANAHLEFGWGGDSDQFGSAAAILAGDLCLSWSDELFTTTLAEHADASGVTPAQARAANVVFDRMRTQLMAGQYLDVWAQAAGGDAARRRGSSVELSRRVIRFKSAKYTIEHPLLIGGTVAGASDRLLEAYSRYGLALGEAFQLRDDVLGVFGDPAQTGKPAGDDLREGKRTVLVGLAEERADAHGRRLLTDGLGNPDLDDAAVDALRAVFERSGALAETERMIADGTSRAVEALSVPDLDEESRRVLTDLAATATARSA